MGGQWVNENYVFLQHFLQCNLCCSNKLIIFLNSGCLWRCFVRNVYFPNKVPSHCFMLFLMNYHTRKRRISKTLVTKSSCDHLNSMDSNTLIGCLWMPCAGCLLPQNIRICGLGLKYVQRLVTYMWAYPGHFQRRYII